MTRNRYRRLWTPLIAGVAGSAISLAVGLGHHAWAAIVIGEVVTAITVVILYVVVTGDSDLGAVLGHGTDERQDLVRLKASRASSLVAVVASVVACVIAAAIDHVYWPFEAIYLLTGAAYLIGLKVYGARDEVDPASAGDDPIHPYRQGGRPELLSE
jgi:uncharacterized membrane protein